MHSFDIFVQSYFSLVRTAPLTEYLYILTILFDLSVHFILICLCVGLLVHVVRGRHYMFLFLSSLLGGSVAVYVLKALFNISRPADAVLSAYGQSFPSGHATVATIFFSLLMYIFDDYFGRFGRIVFNSLCVLGILSVAFSRVYLGVHWASDVLGGLVLGIAVSYISVRLFRRPRFRVKAKFVIK